MNKAMNKTTQVSVDEVVRSLEQTVNGYIETLEHISLEQLLWKPAPAEWSLGQMIMHLIQSAQGMQLANVRRCLAEGLEGDSDAQTATVGVQSTGSVRVEKTVQGERLFHYGSFPPERIAVPASAQYTPPQPECKEQLVDGLRETLHQVMEVAPAVRAVREQVLATCAASFIKLEDRDTRSNSSSNVNKSANPNPNANSNSNAKPNLNANLNENSATSTISQHMLEKEVDTEHTQEPEGEGANRQHELSLTLSLPTVAHPRLGGLNAWEWFWLIEMHYRHHLHQQQRLEEAWAYARA